MRLKAFQRRLSGCETVWTGEYDGFCEHGGVTELGVRSVKMKRKTVLLTAVFLVFVGMATAAQLENDSFEDEDYDSAPPWEDNRSEGGSASVVSGSTTVNSGSFSVEISGSGSEKTILDQYNTGSYSVQDGDRFQAWVYPDQYERIYFLVDTENDLPRLRIDKSENPRFLCDGSNDQDFGFTVAEDTAYLLSMEYNLDTGDVTAKIDIIGASSGTITKSCAAGKVKRIEIIAEGRNNGPYTVYYDDVTHVQNNVPPTFNSNTTEPADPNLNDDVRVEANITDPDGDSIPWANMTVWENSTKIVDNANYSSKSGDVFQWTNFTADETETYNISLTASDGDRTSTSTFNVTISNDAPSISNLNVSPDPVESGNQVNTSADISDSDNNLDQALCSYKYPNGTVAVDNVSMSGTGEGTRWCTTTPETTGTWTVEIFANDTDGASTTDSTAFEVNDRTPPNWRNLQDNHSDPVTPDDTVNVSSEFQDKISGLNKVWLSTNETGIFQNFTADLKTRNNFSDGSTHQREEVDAGIDNTVTYQTDIPTNVSQRNVIIQNFDFQLNTSRVDQKTGTPTLNCTDCGLEEQDFPIPFVHTTDDTEINTTASVETSTYCGNNVDVFFQVYDGHDSDGVTQENESIGSTNISLNVSNTDFTTTAHNNGKWGAFLRGTDPASEPGNLKYLYESDKEYQNIDTYYKNDASYTTGDKACSVTGLGSDAHDADYSTSVDGGNLWTHEEDYPMVAGFVDGKLDIKVGFDVGYSTRQVNVSCHNYNTGSTEQFSNVNSLVDGNTARKDIDMPDGCFKPGNNVQIKVEDVRDDSFGSTELYELAIKYDTGVDKAETKYDYNWSRWAKNLTIAQGDKDQFNPGTGKSRDISTPGEKANQTYDVFVNNSVVQQNITDYSGTPATTTFNFSLSSDTNTFFNVTDLNISYEVRRENESPFLFSNETNVWQKSSHLWNNMSFSGHLGYQFWGRDASGNWNATDTDSFLSTYTPSYTDQNVTWTNISGKETKQLSLTIDDSGEQDINSHNSPPSGSEGLFDNSTLRIDGWTTGSFDWLATVSDDFGRTSNQYAVNYTTTDNGLQEDSYNHNLSTQQVNRTIDLQNRGSNSLDYYLTLYDEGTVVTDGDVSGTVSSGNTVSTTEVWSGDFLTESEFDFSPQSNEVTLGTNYIGDRKLEVVNSKPAQFTSVDTTGFVTLPSGCSQTNNSAVTIGSSSTDNFTVEMSCDPGSIAGDLTQLENTDANNDTWHWWNSTSVDIKTNETENTTLVKKLSESGDLNDWDSRKAGDEALYCNGQKVGDNNWTFTDPANNVRVKFYPNSSCGSSLTTSTDSIGFKYEVGSADTTESDDGGSSGSGGSGGPIGGDDDEDTLIEFGAAEYTVKPGETEFEDLIIRNFADEENSVDITKKNGSACSYVTVLRTLNADQYSDQATYTPIDPAPSGGLFDAKTETVDRAVRIELPNRSTLKLLEAESPYRCQFTAAADFGVAEDLVVTVTVGTTLRDRLDAFNDWFEHRVGEPFFRWKALPATTQDAAGLLSAGDKPADIETLGEIPVPTAAGFVAVVAILFIVGIVILVYRRVA